MKAVVQSLRSLVARGLDSARLRISDAHEDLKAAIAQVLSYPWQRCVAHFARDMKGHVPKSQQKLVAAVSQIFAAPDAAEARRRLGAVVATLERSAPKVARLLSAAEEELLAFTAFPREYRTKLCSTNRLERLSKEIGDAPTSSASTRTTPA